MANSIADVFFRFLGDSSQLEVDAVKAGQAAGSAAGLNTANSFASRFRSTVLGPSFGAGLGAGVGIAAMGALQTAASNLAGTLQDAVGKAMEDQASVKRMTVAFQDSIPGWDDTTGAVQRFIKKGEDLAFTDDQTRDSLTKLVTATGDVGEALDLSKTSMDLARLRGIDLGTATDLVSKAYAGNIGYLRRVLPWIDKNASRTEALAAIQKAAEGQAKTYADTAEGRVARAQIAMDEALESLGYTLLPAVSEAASGAATQVRWFGRFLNDAADAASNLGRIIPGVGEDFDILGSLVDAIPGVAAWKKANEVRDAADAAGEALVTNADSISAVKDSFTNVYGTVGDLARLMPTAVKLGVDRSAREAAKLPGEIAAAIRDRRATWQDALDTLGDDVANSMTRAQEIAKLEAALLSDNVVKGLQSKDPVVKAQAEATAQIIVDRLAELNHLSVGWGESTGNAYADGLERSKVRVNQAAKGLSGIVRDEFQASSPPGPKSSLHLIDVWGERTGQAWADGLKRGVSTVSAGLRAGAPAASTFQTIARAPSAVLPTAAAWPDLVVVMDGDRVGRLVDRRNARLPRH